MRYELNRLLQDISMRIQEEPNNEVRWDAHTLCDYARQFLDLKHCSPSSRLRLWESLLNSGFPVEAQLRLEKYNGTLLREDIAWLLNFLDALEEAAKLVKGTNLPLPVAYDSATREFLFEWTTLSVTETIVQAAHEKQPLEPGLLENWINDNSQFSRGGKALFAECLWTEVPDWEPNAHVLLKDSISAERFEQLANGDDPKPHEIELYRASLASSELRAGRALRVTVWELSAGGGRKAYITSFQDNSGRILETGGPFLTFDEIDKDLREQGFIDSWTFSS